MKECRRRVIRGMRSRERREGDRVKKGQRKVLEGGRYEERVSGRRDRKGKRGGLAHMRR